MINTTLQTFTTEIWLEKHVLPSTLDYNQPVVLTCIAWPVRTYVRTAITRQSREICYRMPSAHRYCSGSPTTSHHHHHAPPHHHHMWRERKKLMYVQDKWTKNMAAHGKLALPKGSVLLCEPALRYTEFWSNVSNTYISYCLNHP